MIRKDDGLLKLLAKFGIPSAKEILAHHRILRTQGWALVPKQRIDAEAFTETEKSLATIYRGGSSS